MPLKDFSRRSLITSLLMTGVVLATLGQELSEYDADSVYYTPIPKPNPMVEVPAPYDRQLFHDTVRQVRTVYFFNFQFGHLFGEKTEDVVREVTFSTSTLHGVTIGRKLRAGIGMGLDVYYDWTAMPIFGSISWDLVGTQNTHALFLQLNYGWPLSVWHTGSRWDYNQSEKLSGGRMFSPQLGYRINYRDIRLSLALGAKLQTFTTVYESPSFFFLPDGTMVEGSPNRTIVDQTLRRFMINVSFGWR
jgi:hypothetical protein